MSENKAPLSPERILSTLTTRWLGREVHWQARIGSTNDEAMRLAEAGCPEGTLVIAEEQLAGRGRAGRRWVAPAGAGLLFSVVLRPALPPAHAYYLTMIAGLAVASAVERETGLTTDLKWPNDVLVRGKKVAGILTEAVFQGEALSYAVVGIGVNVNADPAQLVEAGRAYREQDPTLAKMGLTASSLSAELGEPLPRLPVLAGILRQLEEYYEGVRAGHSPLPAWRARLVGMGEEVELLTPAGGIVGTAVDLTSDGALVVELPGGERRIFHAGQLTLRTHPR